METTEKQYIRKHIRVHLPDQDVLNIAWRKAKNEIRAEIKEAGFDSKHWPQGAKTRSTKIEDIEYFICEIGGGRFERAGFHEQTFTDHTTLDRQTIAELASDAMDHPLCATEGFQIDAECRVYFEYRDEDGEIVPDDMGSDQEPTDWFVTQPNVFKHTPVKCTDTVMRQVQAYQHFLFYIDLDHLKKNDPWSETGMCDHFMSKLKGLYKRESSAGGEHLIDCDSIVKWVQEMTPHNQAKLFNYIFAFHIDRY